MSESVVNITYYNILLQSTSSHNSIQGIAIIFVCICFTVFTNKIHLTLLRGM